MDIERQKLLSTAHAFVSAYNAWTVDSVLSVRSPTCIHRTLPTSTSTPDRNNAEFGKLLESVIPIFRNFHLTILDEDDIIVDAASRKVVLHLQSNADTKAGPYSNEYFFILTMSRDGRQVDKVVEFLDSEYTAQIVGKLGGVAG